MSRHHHKHATNPQEPRPGSSQTVQYSLAQLGPTTASTTQAWNVTAEFHGPGRITGRAIYSFGKFVQHGFVLADQLYSRARIRAMFPHGDNSRVANLDDIYEDVLELSRDFYKKNLRKTALRAIWQQIASAQTLHLINALSKWPREEIDLFLKDLMCCLGPRWTRLGLRPDSPKSMFTRLGDEYFAMIFSTHPLLPFVQFIAQLASGVPVSASGILSSGFLDLLLNLYLRSFLITSASDTHAAAYRCYSLFDTCNTALAHILLSARRCDHKPLRDTMLKTLHEHPLQMLWPRKATMPLSACIRRQFLDRPKTWRALDQVVVLRRLTGIANVISASHEGRGSYVGKSLMPVDFPSDELVNTTTDIFDDFIDLIEFSSKETYGECIARFTIEILNRYFPGVSESLNPELCQIEVVQTMRDWIQTKYWDPSIVEEPSLWSLDLPITSSHIPLTSHIIRNFQINHQLEDASLHIHDKSTLYFSAIFTVMLNTYTHELFGGLSSSTHLSSLSPHPPPKPRPRLIYDARTQYADPSSYDPFCASSSTCGSLVQSWFKPPDTASDGVAMHEPFRTTTKALYEPETGEPHISMPFAYLHAAHMSPKLGNALIGAKCQD